MSKERNVKPVRVSTAPPGNLVRNATATRLEPENRGRQITGASPDIKENESPCRLFAGDCASFADRNQ